MKRIMNKKLLLLLITGTLLMTGCNSSTQNQIEPITSIEDADLRCWKLFSYTNDDDFWEFAYEYIPTVTMADIVTGNYDDSYICIDVLTINTINFRQYTEFNAIIQDETKEYVQKTFSISNSKNTNPNIGERLEYGTDIFSNLSKNDKIKLCFKVSHGELLDYNMIAAKNLGSDTSSDLEKFLAENKELSEVLKASEFNTEDELWEYLCDTYENVTIEDINSGKYKNSFVIINSFAVEVSHFTSAENTSCYMIFEQSNETWDYNRWLCRYDDDTLKSIGLLSGKEYAQEMQDGDIFRSCVYVNEDNSFGWDKILAFQKTGSLKKDAIKTDKNTLESPSDNDSKNDTSEMDAANLAKQFHSEDDLWEYLCNTYKTATIEEIKAGKYTNSYVIIESVAENVEYDHSIDINSCNMYFEQSNGEYVNEYWLCMYDDSTLKQTGLISGKEYAINMKNGDTFRSCVYVNEDNSFGWMKMLAFQKIGEAEIPLSETEEPTNTPEPPSDSTPEYPTQSTDQNTENTPEIPDNTSQQQTSESYVLNTSSMKIHKPSCSAAKKIAPENYSTSDSSISELEAQGYSRCGICLK